MIKNIPILLIFLLFALQSYIYGQNDFPKLVVRADDMGSSQAANTACFEVCKTGWATSVEVMPVGPWFPEAVKILNDNPDIDAGIHLTLSSEWGNIKWRPLTYCPSLTDDNGYFFPAIEPDANYPGLSLSEKSWSAVEVENEFRAQIEMALKNIPHISHISAHMGATTFDPVIKNIIARLAKEYNLPDVSSEAEEYGLIPVTYDGAHFSTTEKSTAFIRMLDKLETGKSYYFTDHPALNNQEMRSIYRSGYENVAEDRQAATNLFNTNGIKEIIQYRGIRLTSYNEILKPLPRSTPEAERVSQKKIDNYLKAIEKQNQDIHSLMILRNGKIVFEKWFGDNAPDKLHIMNSVSKTFTALAIGFAIDENKLNITDKVISFFPDQLPENISPYLEKLTIKHLLTMSAGMDVELSDQIRAGGDNKWVQSFLNTPFKEEPGSVFAYNSMASYMLSAILQEVTDETLDRYLYPRLFRPLGITGVTWDKSPENIVTGGWGLYIKTEDMAKLGQFLLQKGKWNNTQLLPESYIDEATSAQIIQTASGIPGNTDWGLGYGYQIWRCTHNAYRADGARGQLVVVIPDKNAVIITTADEPDIKKILELFWKHLYPAFD